MTEDITCKVQQENLICNHCTCDICELQELEERINTTLETLVCRGFDSIRYAMMFLIRFNLVRKMKIYEFVDSRIADLDYLAANPNDVTEGKGH